MTTFLARALPNIRKFFDKNSQIVYQKRELAQILNKNRETWKVAESTTFAEYLDTLLKETDLKRVVLESKDYKSVTRYTWGDVSPYLIALSLKTGVYLSHGSAVFLHGLNDQIPKAIYLNKEQSSKPPPAGTLSQEAIDRAFAGKQRTSNYVFSFDSYRCVLLSGKNTGELEVSPFTGPSGESVRVTKLERTLVDIAVRPAYSGGVYQVLAAYQGAKDNASVNTIIAVLKKLGYKYPYHQVVGFYMQRAGFDSRKLDRLKTLGLDYDFYLDYGMAKKNTDYDKDWRLFFPKGL